jgi:sterol desaturase/sphingolipid hydroxylase (fatty acid hydroxylase superfamily)
MKAILPILIPSTFLALLLMERLLPGRPLPRVRWWLLKGLFFCTLTGAISGAAGALVAKALGGHTLFHLEALPALAGALVGFVVADFFNYWMHRAMHTVPFLWRWMHQMHHSAERMDLAGMSYAHPLQTVVGFGMLSGAVALLGLDPEAAALAGFMNFAAAAVQHMNVKTPRALGFVVVRPEQHGLHHERDVHAYNYGNCPLWDLVFGTFRNPKDFPADYGFWNGASARVAAMLIGRDVGRAPRVD